MQKKAKIDIALINIAFSWLIIPNIIFIIGNLKFYFSIPIIVALLLSWRQVSHTPIYSKFVKETITFKLLIILFVLAMIIMFSCGIGINTRGDLLFRRAFLNDLIYSNWPVSYLFPNGDIGVFIYYIGDFLPAAVVGKIFGLQSAYFFLNCWNSIGLFLIFYLFIRFIKIFKITPILIFLFFGSLNWVYMLLGTNTIPTGAALDHAFSFSYQSITTDIFWCFNQSIPAIIITLLLVIPSKHNMKNYFFICSLGFIFCPIPLLGLIPILLYLLISKYKLYKFQNTISSFKKYMTLFISFQNIVIPLCLLIVFFPFYINIKQEYTSFFVWQKYSLVYFIKQYIPLDKLEKLRLDFGSNPDNIYIQNLTIKGTKTITITPEQLISYQQNQIDSADLETDDSKTYLHLKSLKPDPFIIFPDDVVQNTSYIRHNQMCLIAFRLFAFFLMIAIIYGAKNTYYRRNKIKEDINDDKKVIKTVKNIFFSKII